MEPIGIRINRIRIVYKVTQSDFAKTIGISQGTLSDIERGQFKPSITTIESIMNHFDVCGNWLISGKCYYNHPQNTCPYFSALHELNTIT